MLTLAIYSIFGFLSSEFWMWVFRPKIFREDPVLRMTVSAFIGCLLTFSLVFIY
jgi:hypothetical protein